MRIGFVSTQYPADLRTSVYGGFKRMGMFIEALAKLGELQMLFYVRPEVSLSPAFVAEARDRLAAHYGAGLKLELCNLDGVAPVAGRWQEYVAPALSIRHLAPYRQAAGAAQAAAAGRLLASRPDMLFVHRLAGMVPVLLSGAARPPTWFDLDDIEHVSFSRSVAEPPLWPGKRLQYLRVPLLKRWERRAIAASRSTFVCSEQDRRYLESQRAPARVVAVPNAVDLPARVPGPAPGKVLLFLGLLSFGPNTAAADHLVRDIWPLVHAAVPEARLVVAGARPEWLSSYQAPPPGVSFPGFVDDLEDLYAEVSVVCCPIRAGSGTRIKILEAAAWGRPVVSTTIGAEGLDLDDGTTILLRDEPRAFADACIALLNDPDRAAELGCRARAVVEQKYVRRAVVDRIAGIIGGA